MASDRKNRTITVSFQDGGLLCTGCAQDVETLLKDTEGILDARVNYAEDTVRVLYDAERIEGKQIVYRLMKTGFRVKVLGG